MLVEIFTELPYFESADEKLAYYGELLEQIKDGE